ncbi:hypothetical protein MPH_14148 [Macrophomina phaseolina MS6]|uniref:Uncharacterized protein n=1 Tax=Macrophomina phaseolina (strain MS6) TaxID=1126212 RepID=K2RWU1_MACPH|nr:hypothetical protein MPH_14148 [Macrophomina phaseolina MS6]
MNLVNMSHYPWIRRVMHRWIFYLHERNQGLLRLVNQSKSTKINSKKWQDKLSRLNRKSRYSEHKNQIQNYHSSKMPQNNTLNQMKNKINSNQTTRVRALNLNQNRTKIQNPNFEDLHENVTRLKKANTINDSSNPGKAKEDQYQQPSQYHQSWPTLSQPDSSIYLKLRTYHLNQKPGKKL